MTTHDYRLSPIHDARIRDERVKRGELASAVDHARATAEDVAAAARRVTAARDAIEAARRAHDAMLATGASPGVLALADRFARRRRRELEAALADELRLAAGHDERSAAIDAARGQLTVARAQRELIERHFARWREARRKLADRRED